MGHCTQRQCKVLEAGHVKAMGQNEDQAAGGENEDEATMGGENKSFVLGFFSWSNYYQGTDRTRGELGTGQALLGLLPNGRSRLIDSENGWHGIS